MRDNYTHIECVGEATFSMAQFDDKYDVLHDFVSIKDISDLKHFSPRGMTALYDAIGTLVDATGQKLSDMKEEDRPNKVIFVIITDGHENASKTFNADQIKEKISYQQDKYAWQFVFIGANQDAILTAGSLGISKNNALNYSANAAGTSSLYRTLGENLTSYRCSKAGDSADFFSDADRKAQDEAKNAPSKPTKKTRKSKVSSV